jgi:hypothetical protein
MPGKTFAVNSSVRDFDQHCTCTSIASTTFELRMCILEDLNKFTLIQRVVCHVKSSGPNGPPAMKFVFV